VKSGGRSIPAKTLRLAAKTLRLVGTAGERQLNRAFKFGSGVGQ
jgi:hypothetical protein